MINLKANIEIDRNTYLNCIEGTDLLNAKLNYDRQLQGKTPVHVNEDYFLRSAIQSYLEDLRNDSKVENFN